MPFQILIHHRNHTNGEITRDTPANLEKTDAFRRPERFAQALLACEADSRGRLGLENDPYPQRQYLQAARDAAATVKPTPEDIADQVGPLIAERVHQRRLRTIEEMVSRTRSSAS